MSSARLLLTKLVMSLSMPALAYSTMTPPPQEWKMSGGSPAWMVAWIRCLNASLSNIVSSTVTPGVAASKAAITRSRKACRGSSPAPPWASAHEVLGWEPDEAVEPRVPPAHVAETRKIIMANATKLREREAPFIRYLLE